MSATDSGVRVSPAAPGYGSQAQPRMGFFTDTTVCIGCKACEVACKEWNDIPAIIGELSGDSYDNHRDGLDANTWRHVTFIEQPDQAGGGGTSVTGNGEELRSERASGQKFRWLMSSDVCKHCTTAACLDVCPTGSLFKTEFGTVVVQPDICNGCGYCIPACPYGVIGKREGDGRAWKCTLCYDRLKVGEEPACAKACPTDSINFGTLDDLQAMADERLAQVVEAGLPGAQLYGDGPSRGVDGAGSIFLLLDDPEVYGLPPDPIATTKDLPSAWRSAAWAAGALAVGVVASFLGVKR
jgi:formate dehydrogenase iron-sulfur subunit